MGNIKRVLGKQLQQSDIRKLQDGSLLNNDWERATTFLNNNRYLWETITATITTRTVKKGNSQCGLVFVTGRGRAGFHSSDSTHTRGRGGMFQVIPAPPPSGAHTHSFPGRGPVCYDLFLTGTRLGYGWAVGLSGKRGRECQKRHHAPGC